MIEVRPSPTADTRSCDVTKVTKDELMRSSHMHIQDVQNALRLFADMLMLRAAVHDEDKISDIDGFHANFKTSFKERDWLDRHYKKNRHHLDQPAGVPEDVNLFDVLDMIADQVMAGTTRGNAWPITISDEVLMWAFKNTVALLQCNVTLVPLDT